MSRWTQSTNHHVHTRRMTEQPLDWLDDDPDLPANKPIRCWRSRDFSAMLFRDEQTGYQRLAITRTQYDRHTGEYRDGITWDDLQRIKNQTVGETTWAVECYPPEDEVENVANMRHLWILDHTPDFGWKHHKGTQS